MVYANYRKEFNALWQYILNKVPDDVSKEDVERIFAIRSKTKITTAIKDILDICRDVKDADNNVYFADVLANAMLVTIYLTEIRDEVVGNETFGGRHDY